VGRFSYLIKSDKILDELAFYAIMTFSEVLRISNKQCLFCNKVEGIGKPTDCSINAMNIIKIRGVKC